MYFPRLKLFSAMEPCREWGMFSLMGFWFVDPILWHKIGAMRRQTELIINMSTMHSQFSEGSFNGFHPNCCVLNWILVFYIFFLTNTMYTVGKNNGGDSKLLQTTEARLLRERHAVSGRMCSHSDPPWQQQIDILIQTPLWGMPGWLRCIHGFVFVF